MSFDSLAFLFFFVPFLGLYYVLPSKVRPIFALIGSYIFYSSINLAFLPLILFSTIVDYFCGRGIESKPVHSKNFLLISLFLNLGMLFFFKYYIFAATNFNKLFDVFDLGYNLPLIKIFFPVGISFYTIQTIGYTVDVYKGHIKPEKNFVTFALFVCFFPQLIAGPLERAKKLIPQFSNPSTPTYNQTQKYFFFILLGLVKKTVISDRLFALIQHNLQNPAQFEHASKNFISFYLMYYRLYYDFSAYSIMALGIAGLLGIHLSKNFHYPIYITNIADFWRRWHITLHDWLKDYIYKPLRESHVNKIVAVYIVFIVSGFWHGPDWNFIFWGFLNATYLLIYNVALLPFLKRKPWAQKSGFKILSSIFNCHLIAVTTPFYFVNNINDTFTFIKNAFRWDQLQLDVYWSAIPFNLRIDILIIVLIVPFLEVVSLRTYLKEESVEDYYKKPLLLNGAIVVLFLLTFFLSKESGPLFRYYFF